MDDIKYFAITCGIVLAIGILIFLRRIKQGVLNIFGGSIDKIELGGIVFTIYLGKMIHEEAERADLQYHVYNELYIFFVAGAAMTGLGLSKVLDTIKEIKSGSIISPPKKEENESPQ